jgi:hypothetical protein
MTCVESKSVSPRAPTVRGNAHLQVQVGLILSALDARKQNEEGLPEPLTCPKGSRSLAHETERIVFRNEDAAFVRTVNSAASSNGHQESERLRSVVCCSP